jgi:hypothetical protein
MGKTTKAGKAAGAAGSAYATARSNQYVQRIVEDDELRDNLREAYDAARHAFDRITSNGKSPVKAVTSDKKVQRDLRTAADSLREASEQLRGRKRKSRFGRILLFGVVVGGVTLAVSENARKTVMDAVFGAEEEFEYTSTTSASSESGSGNSGSGASS